MRARCNMLWIGSTLGAVERASMRSVLRQGHPLTLWCYGKPAGVPLGVTVRDASEVLPFNDDLRHHTGSVALFADWFRYELQQRSHGVWLDSDVYLLKPLPDAEYILTEEEPGRINGGVLRLPADSPMLPPLLALFRKPEIPPWLPLRDRPAARLRQLLSGKVDLGRLPWGIAGPVALTALARRFGLAGAAAPPALYSPVRWQDAEWVRSPSITLESVTFPQTIAVHLWNERIKLFKDQPAPKGSFLAILQREGADIDDSAGKAA